MWLAVYFGICICVSVCSSQEVPIVAAMFSQPSCLAAWNGSYALVTRNGELSIIDDVFSGTDLVKPLVGKHVEYIMSVDNHLVAITSAGTMHVSTDAKNWETLSESYARLFINAAGRPMLLSTKALVSYRHDGQIWKRDTIEQFALSRLPRAFAFRNDTLVVVNEDSDSLEIFVRGAALSKTRIQSQFIQRFVQLADGTILAHTRFESLYSEPADNLMGSGWRKMFPGFQRVVSITQSIDSNGPCAFVVGIDHNQTSQVYRIGSGLESVSIPTLSDSIRDRMSLVCSDLSSLVIASESGLLTKAKFSQILQIKSYLQPAVRQLNRGITKLRGDHALFATLVNDSTGHRSFTVMQNESAIELLSNVSQNLRDSLGELSFFHQNADGSEVAVFTTGIARRSQPDAAWQRVHTFRTFIYAYPKNLTVDDSLMIWPHFGQSIAVSRDLGKTWRTHVLPGLPRFTHSNATDKKIFFTTDFEIRIISRTLNLDTIEQTKYNLGYVSSLHIVEVNGSSITAAYGRSSNDSTLRSIDRIHLLRLSLNAELLDSSLTSISPPLTGTLTMRLFNDTLVLWCPAQDRFLLLSNGLVTRDLRVPFFTEPYRQSATTIATLVSPNEIVIASALYDAKTTIRFEGDSVTGITSPYHESHVSSMSLYPNPTYNQLSIRYKLTKDTDPTRLHFMLYDVNGFQVKHYMSQSSKMLVHDGWVTYEVDIDNLPSGSYYLVAEGAAAEIHTKRLLILR